ncbi:MAG: outer membrane protein assembly factor BamE [Thermodesulfobacteriota bacterium]
MIKTLLNDKTTLLAASVSLMLALSGCASYKTYTEGPPVYEATVKEIKPGVTKKEEVISTLGEPSSITEAEGAEKLLYVYTVRRVPSYLGGAFEDTTAAIVRETTLEVTIKNGIVFNYDFKYSEK